MVCTYVYLYIYSPFIDGQPLLASGGSAGVISIWNMEKKRLQAVIREAHDSSITSLHFFTNEPMIMSSSTDNSIKVSLLVVSCWMQPGNSKSLTILFYTNFYLKSKGLYISFFSV